MEYLLKKRELDNSSKPNWTKATGSQPEKNATSRKSYSLLLQVTLQMGEVEVNDDDEEWEPFEAITNLRDSVLGYWGLSA